MNIYSGKPNSMNNKFLQEAFISYTLQFRDTRDKNLMNTVQFYVYLRYLNLT